MLPQLYRIETKVNYVSRGDGMDLTHIIPVITQTNLKNKNGWFNLPQGIPLWLRKEITKYVTGKVEISCDIEGNVYFIKPLNYQKIDLSDFWIERVPLSDIVTSCSIKLVLKDGSIYECPLQTEHFDTTLMPTLSRLPPTPIVDHVISRIESERKNRDLFVKVNNNTEEKEKNAKNFSHVTLW
jgi:hypothetical protein